MGRVLRWTTAGESHGRALVAVVEGMVAPHGNRAFIYNPIYELLP